MQCQNVISIVLFLLMADIGETANILVTVVGMSASQNLLMYRLAELMGQRGHNVTLLKADLMPDAKSIPLKHAKEITYPVAVAQTELMDEMKAQMSSVAWSAPKGPPIGLFKTIFRTLRESCEVQLRNDEFLQSLNDSHFDVVVIHFVDFCTFGLTKALGIDAYVWMSTAMLLDPMAWYSGTPLGLSYVPNMIVTSDPSGRLSLWERMKNVFFSTALMGVFEYGIVSTYTDVFRKRFGPDYPPFGDILRKTQLYFDNTDPLFEYARPLPANVISVGGLTMTKPEPLTEKWQNIMDEAPKEGVVIFSLGSIANTTAMPQEIRLSFLNAFKRLPHLFIWRFVGDFPEAKSVKNVLLSDWLPQKDLMAHPNTKAALIHGGYNSITESTYLGVPMVVMPLFGDQHANVIRVTRQNVGVGLDRNGLTEQKVYDALHKVLYDKTIQENAKRLGHMIREKPFSSLQQATEWLEYLAKFKRLDQLQPPSQELYLHQYLLLDVAAIILTVLVTVITLLVLLVKVCTRLICKCFGAQKGTKQKAA